MPTEPIDDIVILPSVIGFHVVPPSVDLPGAAAGGAEPAFVRPRVAAFGGNRSPAARRPNVPPPHAAVQAWIDG